MLARTKIESSERQLCLKIVRRIRLVSKALCLRADDTEATSHPEVPLKWSGFLPAASTVFKLYFVAIQLIFRSMTVFSFSALCIWDVCYSTRAVKYLAYVSTSSARVDSDGEIKSSRFTLSPHMSIITVVIKFTSIGTNNATTGKRAVFKEVYGNFGEENSLKTQNVFKGKAFLFISRAMAIKTSVLMTSDEMR